MRIDSSTIGMESTRRYASSTTRSSRYTVKDYRGNAAHQTGNMFGNLIHDTESETDMNKQNAGEENKGNTVSLSDALDELRYKVESMRRNVRTNSVSSMDSFKQYTIRSILAMLLGGERSSSMFQQGNTLSIQEGNQNVLTLQSESFYEESECTTFSTTGNVRTADGREISINVDVSMSRSFTQYFKEEMEIMQINTCDPLVLNFDGNAVELSDQKFYFDIDGDGKEDKISRLGSGSGYLALDKNKDGVINDGNELFGTKSGDGFSDLSKLDSDGNGWIDENDDVWSMLKIWSQNEDGGYSLCSLTDKGIGAICLQNTDTNFSLNNEQNQTNGYIRKSGLFLYENGIAGTVQHLDLAN